MASTRVVTTLVLALTLSLAASVTAQPVSGPEFIPLVPPAEWPTRATPTGPTAAPF
jgi:hypothetical protein